MQGRHINNCNELGLNAILNYSIYKKINTIYICTYTHIDTNEIHFFCSNWISYHILIINLKKSQSPSTIINKDNYSLTAWASLVAQQ